MAGIQEIKCKFKSYEERLDQSSKDRIKICKELEQYILSLEPDVLLEILKQENHYGYWGSKLKLPNMIIYHTLMTSHKQIYINSLYQNNARKILKGTANDYLTLYCNGVTPSESLQTLCRVRGLNLYIESELMLYYCKNLLKYKHYDLVKQLINDNMEYFVSTFNFSVQTCEVQVLVMLYILSQSITQGKIDIIKRTVSLINKCCSQYNLFDQLHIPLLPSHLVLSLIDKDCIPSIVNLKGFNMNGKIIPVQVCLIQCLHLIKQNKYKEYQSFFEQHIQFFISMAGELTSKFSEFNNVPCKVRQQYSVALMYYCGVSTNTHNTDLVINTIHKFQLDLLLGEGGRVCYCYGGKRMCFNKKKNHYQTKLDLEYETEIKCIWIVSNQRLLEDRVNKRHQTESNTKSEILEKFYKCMIDVIEDKCEEEYSIDDIINETSKIVDKILHEEGLFDREEAADEYEYELTDIITTLCNIEMNSDIQNIMVQGLMKPFQEMVYSKEEKKLSILMLDLHMAMKGNIFLTKLTQCVGDLLHFGEDINEKKILHKCFCIVRAACRRSEESCADIEKYIKHFTFISMFDKEEELMKLSKHIDLLIMLMFLLTTVTLGGHHKSAALKKYLSLKYEYDKAILYLLWCSGDVEINPGPTLKKLKRLRMCEKERKWIHETCSTLVKLVKGKSIDSKPKSLWKCKPDNWPSDQPFFDPNNKPKVCNDESHSDERLLVCLLEHCDKHGTSIPHPLQLEINEWKVGNKSELFERFIKEIERKEIMTAINALDKYKESPELKECWANVNITFDTKVSTLSQNPTQSIAHVEIVRDLALTFCRIANKLNPLEKSDGIWKKPPRYWNPEKSFYSPHNAGKRSEKGQDKHLVDNLLKHCKEKQIPIPKSLNEITEKWKKWSEDISQKGNKKDLHQVYTVWTNTVIIERSLKYLQRQGILNKPCFQKELEKNGLKLDPKAWNLNFSIEVHTRSPCPESDSSSRSSGDQKDAKTIPDQISKKKNPKSKKKHTVIQRALPSVSKSDTNSPDRETMSKMCAADKQIPPSCDSELASHASLPSEPTSKSKDNTESTTTVTNISNMNNQHLPKNQADREEDQYLNSDLSTLQRRSSTMERGDGAMVGSSKNAKKCNKRSVLKRKLSNGDRNDSKKRFPASVASDLLPINVMGSDHVGSSKTDQIQTDDNSMSDETSQDNPTQCDRDFLWEYTKDFQNQTSPNDVIPETDFLTSDNPEAEYFMDVQPLFDEISNESISPI